MKKALILAALLTCGSAHAQSLEVDVRIAPGGGLQYLTFTSREDSIVLTGFIINRGNCLEARGPGGAQKLFNLPKIDMHQTIRFGETVNYLIPSFPSLCDPIEVDVFTDKGNSTFSLDGGGSGKPLDVIFYPHGGLGEGNAPYVHFRSREDSITIRDIRVNRGNCKSPQHFQLPLTLKFGQRLSLIYVTCKPIEVDVSTDKGDYTFSF